MKKLLSSLCLALICSTLLFAYDCEIDGIYYNLNTTEMTAEVTYRDLYNLYVGAVVIPSSINYQSQTYSVTTIGKRAFYCCSKLTSIDIPYSVTMIGYEAFAACPCLTSVAIPNSVTTIGDYAFIDCFGLTSVTIGNSVTEIGRMAFSGCSSLTSITIPNSVTAIGDYAFKWCGLTSITIPYSVTTIGDYAFYSCSGLTSVTIGNSVTTIGKGAFYGCSSLTSVTIPNSVKTIGEGAFSYCSYLTSITCEANKPPVCGNDCFDNVDKSIPLYVPSLSINAYQLAHEWEEFYDIQAITGDALDNIRLANPAQKVLHNGTLVIDRNGQYYSAMGERVR